MVGGYITSGACLINKVEVIFLLVVVSEWKDGRRCTMMDKDSPLSSMKHGRLYLTPK